jgi:hypothetical protein
VLILAGQASREVEGGRQGRLRAPRLQDPVILRPEGAGNKFRFVGDAYVDEYMDGRAVREWKDCERMLEKYLLI